MQTVRYCNVHTTHTRPDKLTTQKEHEQREIVLLNLGIVHPAQTVLEELAHHVAVRMGVHGRAHHLAGDRSSPSSILQPGVVWKCLLVVQANKLFQATIHTRLTHPPCHPYHPLQVMEAPKSEPTHTLRRWRHCTHIPQPCLRPPWLPRSQLTSVRPSQTLKSHRPPTNATFVTGICHGSKTGDHAHAGR